MRWEIAIAPILGRIIRNADTGDAVAFALGTDEGIRFMNPAHARLAAAAPELLQMLESVLPQVMGDAGPAWDLVHWLRKMVPRERLEAAIR